MAFSNHTENLRLGFPKIKENGALSQKNFLVRSTAHQSVPNNRMLLRGHGRKKTASPSRGQSIVPIFLTRFATVPKPYQIKSQKSRDKSHIRKNTLMKSRRSYS
jgi:hypothetical protein